MIRRRRVRRSPRQPLACFEQLEDRRLLAVFAPSKDNSLFESEDGSRSAGQNPHLYAGMTRQASDPARRALLAFDLSSIPDGAHVTDAALELTVTRNPFASLAIHPFSLHRVTTNWGEGDSGGSGELGLGGPAATGDATWLHSSFATELWATPGGDFAAEASATTEVGNDGSVARWSSAELVNDVRAWIENPEQNFGWIVVGDETATGTARRFASRESDGPAPPQLDVTFVPGITLSAATREITESGGSVDVTGTLAFAQTEDVTVDLSFSGTASATDFAASASQIVIPAGQLTGAVSVTAMSDATDEFDETVVVSISNVANAVEEGIQAAVVSIVDDDDAPQVTLEVEPESIAEADGVATVTASLSEASDRDVHVSLGLSGTAEEEDYVLGGVTETVFSIASQDFTVTPVFSDVRTFAFELDLAIELAPSAFSNPSINSLDYSVSGTLAAGTPSMFSGFALSRSIGGSEFYDQGGSIDFEVVAGADLSDGLQVSELAGPDPVFVLNAREENTGRFHPALLELNSDGTGRIQNSNNVPRGAEITMGIEYITDLSFDPASLTLAVPQQRIVIPAGSTSGTATLTAVQDEVAESDESIVVDVTEILFGQEADAQQVGVMIIDDDVAPTFRVTQLTPTSSGFDVSFSDELDPEPLNLYDAQGTGFGPADVALFGEVNGEVLGSLVLGEPGQLTFIKSGDPLEPDTYTVRLRSGENGVVSQSGLELDGDADGTSGDDFLGEFIVDPIPGEPVVVGIPDFVRGPGQDVNLPADQALGIPLSISDGTGVTAIQLRIKYDPQLLEVAAASVGEAAPEGATVVLDRPEPGMVDVTFVSPSALPAGSSAFAQLEALIPVADADENYRRQQRIDIQSLVVRDTDDNSIASLDDDALHVVTFFADTSANGRINASDAALVARSAALLDGGFPRLLRTNPLLVGDVSGNGRLNAADASLVAQFTALLPVPQIPAVPAGVSINVLAARTTGPTLDRFDLLQELDDEVSDWQRSGGDSSAIVADGSHATEARALSESFVGRELEDDLTDLLAHDVAQGCHSELPDGAVERP